MMAWWQAREPRERLALLLAAVFVLASLIYYLAWQPLDQAYDRQLARRQAQTDNLLWMRQAALEVKALGGQRRRPSGPQRPLLAEAERAAAGNGMKASLKQLNPEGEDKLRVTVQDAEFDAFIRWLGRLDSAGVDIGSLNLTRQDGGSRIQARLLLERRS